MNEKITKEIFDNWMNSTRETIPFPNLMNELLEFGNKMSDNLLKSKANRIYIKCIRAKKLQLAEKIANKYKLNQIKDDAVIAMSLAMQAYKRYENGK